MRGVNNIQQNRSSNGCLFSIDLGDPGRIVDGAPYGPSLVLARLAVARGTTAVLQVGAVCSNKRFFLRSRRHCTFLLRVIRIGGDLQDKSELFDGSQVNSIVTPIYKNREKRIFEFGVRLDPPH